MTLERRSPSVGSRLNSGRCRCTAASRASRCLTLLRRMVSLSGGKTKIGGAEHQDEHSQCRKLLHVITPFLVEPAPLFGSLDPSCTGFIKTTLPIAASSMGIFRAIISLLATMPVVEVARTFPKNSRSTCCCCRCAGARAQALDLLTLPSRSLTRWQAPLG